MPTEEKTRTGLLAEIDRLQKRIGQLEISLKDIRSRDKDSGWERDMGEHYLDVAGVIIMALNKWGEITLINKKGCEILGRQERELIGKNWFDHFIPADSIAEVKTVFQKLMNGESTVVQRHDNPILTSDKGLRIIAWYNMVMRDDKGAAIGVLSSGEDITERKLAEEALKESEEKYRTLIMTSPDAVTVSDLDGRITYVSRQTLELHGYEKSYDMLGKNAFDLIDGRQRAKAMLNQQRTLKEGIIKNEEYILKRRDGSSFIGEMNAAVIRDSEGNPKMFIATTRDITERKNAEEQLKTSVKEKELLLQEIHHRVKNNLQIISSILDMSSLRIQDRKAVNLIADARDKIQTMTFIHSQLYRSERFDRIDMGSHIRELVDYLSALYARGKDITPHIEVEDVRLSLTQAIPCALVLNELISNAFKHAFRKDQKGSIVIEMTITAGDWVSISVKDDGIGMDNRVNVFKTESLGLKLVRKLVEKQLGGSIQVRRAPFTEFIVRFPLWEEV